MPGFDVNFFFGIAAPAKVPPGVVARLKEAIGEITDMPDVRARMEAAFAADVTGRASVIDGATLEIHGTRVRLYG